MDKYMKQWLLISCIGLVILFGCLFLASCSHREPTSDERVLAEEMKSRLKIATEGDVVKWKSGLYSVIIQVDGMPRHGNGAVRFLTGGMRDTDWSLIEAFSILFYIADVFNYREGMSSGAKAIYAEALRKAVLGKVDHQDKPAPAN